MTRSLVQFMKAHYKDPQGQRLGQKFCNLYLKDPNPELFYAKDEDAAQLIQFWLIDNQYEESLPECKS